MMFSASVAVAETNTYDFDCEDNAHKWKGVFINSLKKVTWRFFLRAPLTRFFEFLSGGFWLLCCCFCAVLFLGVCWGFRGFRGNVLNYLRVMGFLGRRGRGLRFYYVKTNGICLFFFLMCWLINFWFNLWNIFFLVYLINFFLISLINFFFHLIFFFKFHWFFFWFILINIFFLIIFGFFRPPKYIFLIFLCCILHLILFWIFFKIIIGLFRALN